MGHNQSKLWEDARAANAGRTTSNNYGPFASLPLRELGRHVKCKYELLRRVWNWWKNECFLLLRYAHPCQPSSSRQHALVDGWLSRTTAWRRCSRVAKSFPGADGTDKYVKIYFRKGHQARRAAQWLHPLDANDNTRTREDFVSSAGKHRRETPMFAYA
ncbi:hypothetical protein MTO96_040240 [Rhipicephalus appendiculatus]